MQVAHTSINSIAIKFVGLSHMLRTAVASKVLRGTAVKLTVPFAMSIRPGEQRQDSIRHLIARDQDSNT